MTSRKRRKYNWIFIIKNIFYFFLKFIWNTNKCNNDNNQLKFFHFVLRNEISVNTIPIFVLFPIFFFVPWRDNVALVCFLQLLYFYNFITFFLFIFLKCNCNGILSFCVLLCCVLGSPCKNISSFSFLCHYYFMKHVKVSLFFCSVFNLIKDYLKWLNAIPITGKEFGLNGPFVYAITTILISAFFCLRSSHFHSLFIQQNLPKVVRDKKSINQTL